MLREFFRPKLWRETVCGFPQQPLQTNQTGHLICLYNVWVPTTSVEHHSPLVCIPASYLRVSGLKISDSNQVTLILAVFLGPSRIQTNIQTAEQEMIPAGVGVSSAVRCMFTVQGLDDSYWWERQTVLYYTQTKNTKHFE